MALACFLGCAAAEIPRPVDAPQPLPAAQTAASYRLPDGFRLEVAASEPLIASPSGLCWDEHGHLFVTELHGYNLPGQLEVEELNRTGRLDTQVRRVPADKRFYEAARAGTYGVVKRLRDTDGDGRPDAADLWATNLPPAYGLVPARGGVIVAAAPDIVFLADRDGDGRAEVRETLFTGFPTGELERGVNAPLRGDDGWIYFGRGWGGGKIHGPRLPAPVDLPNTDFRIRPDGSAIEPVTGGTETFGHALTDAGDRFVVNTTTVFHVAPLPWRYLARNPDAAFTGLAEATGDRRAYARSQPHPWRTRRAEDPEYFKFYRDRYGASDSEAAGWFTALCGPLVYRDRALPGLHGHFLACEPAGNLIHRALLVEDGAVLRLRRAPGEEQAEFAASTDAWSHPIFLAHGPDGALWVVDYYREIIEDYSAIPRHLQQQYGLYAGHDRGRIYRLTHRDLPPAPPAAMAGLDNAALARECAGPLLWRRQTAQRLLVERGAREAAPALRAGLRQAGTEPAAVVTLLRTLEQLGELTPDDVIPLLGHAATAVRVHALQAGDRWFGQPDGRALLEAALDAAAAERHPRVLLQHALSLGESPDPRALQALARIAREHADVRWMDAAILSSVSGRAVELLGLLANEPGGSGPLLGPLARSIAAGRREADLRRTLEHLAGAPAEMQATVLNGLAAGAGRGLETDAALVRSLAWFRGSADRAARDAANALAGKMQAIAALAEEAALPEVAAEAPPEAVSDEAFRQFVAALAGPRDPARGRVVFQQACASCHRLGEEGHDFGPDLRGQLGMAEETLLQDILRPGERLRPGFETVEVRLAGGDRVAGILKDDGATSLTLRQPGGVEQVLLRRDVAEVRRLPGSLMPSFAETLTPEDAAHLLAWLRRGGP